MPLIAPGERNGRRRPRKAGGAAGGRTLRPGPLRQSVVRRSAGAHRVTSAHGSAAAARGRWLTEGLDALRVRARFGRLVNEGYDFELSQHVR